jgi:hypothetical protein
MICKSERSISQFFQLVKSISGGTVHAPCASLRAAVSVRYAQLKSAKQSNAGGRVLRKCRSRRADAGLIRRRKKLNYQKVYLSEALFSFKSITHIRAKVNTFSLSFQIFL